MARWLVTRAYATQTLGPWRPGDEVELDDETAAFVQRDSPGALLPMEDTDKPTRSLDRPPVDRQVKSAQRRDRQGDPSDEGPITKADHKAVKNKGD